MKADQERGGGPAWPGWLEALRPDDVARRRIREAVMERARPILSRRRPAGAWEVAAGWADVLVPVAAVASVLLTVFALQDGGRAARTASGPAGGGDQGVRIQELLVEPGAQEPPALLTRARQPDLDGVLEAAIYYDGER